MFLLAPLRANTRMCKRHSTWMPILPSSAAFFHESTKTPREVFGSHHGESLSSLLVKVTMTPPLSLRQAIASSPRAAAVAMKTPAATRMAGAHGGGSNGGGTNNQQSTKSTETATMTPTTSFVELYLIYYYYLFIYHYVDCDVALSRCRHR